jgi:hypothetical protein
LQFDKFLFDNNENPRKMWPYDATHEIDDFGSMMCPSSLFTLHGGDYDWSYQDDDGVDGHGRLFEVLKTRAPWITREAYNDAFCDD